jgi:hypothetical protein
MKSKNVVTYFVEACLRLAVVAALGTIFVGATIPACAAEPARTQAPAATPSAAPSAAAAPAAAQIPVTTTATTAAATPAAVWQALNEPVMDPAKSTVVENLILIRDRIRITLIGGVIEFTAPVNGKPFGAIFRGKGLVEIAPPNFMERQQLHEFTGQDTLSMPFTEGVLWFTDKTYDEIAGQVRWKTADTASDNLFAERSKRDGSPRARLFKGILSLDRSRTALFEADLHSDAKGWIQVTDDALEPEEISAGRWVNPYGYWQFETWLSFPAANRTAEAAFRFPLAKSDFHVASYDIDATVTGGAELEATTRVHLEMLAAGEQVLSFTLNPHLRVDSVKDGAGHSLEFFQPRDPGINGIIFDQFLEVALPAAASFDPMTLEFHYAGKRVVHNMGGGNYFCESFGWYPAVENEFALRSDFDMTFQSPKEDEFVATGNKVSESVDGKWRVTKWKSDPSISVAGFAFGNYKVTDQDAGDAAKTEIEVYANKNPDDVLALYQLAGEELEMPLGTLDPAHLSKAMGIELGNMVRLFENYYGPYPYHTLAITNIPGDYGQGWPGLIYLSEISFLDQTQQVELGIPLKDLILLSDYFRGHETSHQWWGHKVGWKSYHDQWLSEGFAQFSGNLYVEFRDSQKQYLTRLREDRDELLTKDLRGHTFESLGPIWMGYRLAPSDEPQAYQTVIYDKGGLVLHMLRMMLYDPGNPDPDTHFKAMMQDYTSTYNNKSASTEDFKAIVEKHMVAHMDVDGNHRMDWFFNQYVYGTGVPEYHFSYSSSAASDGKVKVTLVFDRTGVPDGWRDTLPVYMYHGGKPVLAGWVSIGSNHQTVDFEMPAAPEKLAINANEDILALVKQ